MAKNFISLLTLYSLLNETFSQNQLADSSSVSTYGITENSVGNIFVGCNSSETNFDHIIISTDSGLNWTYSDSGISQYIYPDFIKVDGNDNIYFAGNSNNIFRSSDNGLSWTFLNAFWDIRALSISDNNFIFAGVDDSPPVYLVRSTDEGNSWEDITGIIHHPVWALESFLNNVYAGAEGRLYHSTDYGDSWDTVSTFTSSWISTIFVNDSGYIFVGTWNDGLYVSKDSMYSWQKIFNSTDYISSIQENGNGVLFILKGFIQSNGEVIYRSTDIGLSWELVDNGLPDIFAHSLLVSRDNSLYITTYENGIFKSTNDGNNWFSINLPTGVDINAFEILNEFTLSQNFPNPFNPTTKISWQLPEASFVTLKIFNSLGEEVETLVNEFMNAGIHSKLYIVNSALSSGVYFYQLKAGDYLQTKKMILIK